MVVFSILIRLGLFSVARIFFFFFSFSLSLFFCSACLNRFDVPKGNLSDDSKSYLCVSLLSMSSLSRIYREEIDFFFFSRSSK